MNERDYYFAICVVAQIIIMLLYYALSAILPDISDKIKAYTDDGILFFGILSIIIWIDDFFDGKFNHFKKNLIKLVSRKK